ncbi:MAG TPA: UDP-N-acetylmuramate dehydrogenase [Paludibaculum sp.]|jgi:UDP-N-acetylmuramate dehydrogenase
MISFDEAHRRLAALPSIQVTRNEPLSRHTRFALGGPATIFADTSDEATFVEALRLLHSARLPWLVIGLGTNLIVADRGYRGVVLRYTGSQIEATGASIHAQAGAPLQSVVDLSTAAGLQGMESLTGIPGNLGAAIYGNAGAYGASLSDIVRSVRYFDGNQIREADHAACQFRYRGSIFKQCRLAGQAWLILSAELSFRPGDPAALQAKAGDILTTRNRKYPPDMKCAGSIFKNLILAELPPEARAAVPPEVVKGGKVPAAWFLEEAGAKGLTNGGIRVTDYHSNTLYNTGNGTTAQFLELTAELKRRVRARHNFTLEEEVQKVGFDERPLGLDQLETTPFILQYLLTGLTPEELHTRPANGGPSIAEILAQMSPAAPPFALNALESFLKARQSMLEVGGRTPWSARDPLVAPATNLAEMAAQDLTHIIQIAETIRTVKYYPQP